MLSNQPVVVTFNRLKRRLEIIGGSARGDGNLAPNYGYPNCAVTCGYNWVGFLNEMRCGTEVVEANSEVTDGYSLEFISRGA